MNIGQNLRTNLLIGVVNYQKNTLRSFRQKSNDLGVVQEFKLTFEGDTNENNPKQADGKLNLIQVVSGGKELYKSKF